MHVAIMPEHIEAARRIATARQGNRENAKTASVKQDSDRTDLQVHLFGALGEVVAASVLGSLDRPTHHQIDRGVDLYMHDGRSASVKARETMRQWACNPGRGPESFKADVGVLVWMGRGIIERGSGSAILAGWFDRDDFKAHAKWVQFGMNRRFAYPNEKLRDIETLVGAWR